MNNIGKKLCLVVLCPIWITGCHFRPFQPSPDMYKYWSKSGQSDLAIKKAMLECGFPGIYDWPTWATSDKNEDALMYRCMERSGFTYLGDQNSFCDGWHKDTKPFTCDESVPAPERDISKRINSEFCHRYPRADVCSE